MSKIALLSNVNIDSLKMKLRKDNEVYLPQGYGGWMQEILNEASGLYKFKPEVIVCIPYGNDLMASWSSEEEGKEAIDQVFFAFSKLLENFPKSNVLIGTLDIAQKEIKPICSKRKELFFENYWYESIFELNSERCAPLDIKEIVSEHGRDLIYSNKLWYAGSMPFSPKGNSFIAKEIRDIIFALEGNRKKCIALDLDNTLWGGVIGEDGIEGIGLSEYKEGARYKDAQKRLKELKDIGVLLCVVSKNNEDDAMEGINKHPSMVLRKDDFVALNINWKTKAENIQDIAQELNIGLDSFVFLDDNPAEREQMKDVLPEVSVIDFPKDVMDLEKTIIDMYKKYFYLYKSTKEDLEKTKMYQAEGERKKIQKRAVTLSDYLKLLEIEIEIHRLKDEEFERVHQLTHKTNQFNLTTIRYSKEDLENIKDDKNYKIYTVHTRDKYGDNGLVCVVIVHITDDNSSEIETFLMSCRVMGRDIEKVVLSKIMDSLKSDGIEEIKGEYIKTLKNAPVEDFYDKMEFECEYKDENTKKYKKDLSFSLKTEEVYKKIEFRG